MEFVQRLSLYICITALSLLLIGMFKPWMMLWWEDVQNRKKVIKLYGSVALTCFIIYLLFFLLK